MVSRLLIFALWPFLLLGLLISAQAAPLDNAVGRAFFEQIWVSAPATTHAIDGLGPMFDARACASCHPKAGPGAVLTGRIGDGRGPGFIVKLARPGGLPDPVYGAQLNTQGIQGMPAEGVATVTAREENGLRRLALRIGEPAFGPLSPDIRVSLRRAPNLRGVGRLMAIPETTILANAAAEPPEIRGRPNWLSTPEGVPVLGRLGWKAGEPDLAQQAALAFSRDMGLSTRFRLAPYGDCTAAEAACRAGPHGEPPGVPEVRDQILDAIAGYLGRLPPPPAKNAEGSALFAAIGCTACHASLPDGSGGRVPAYTDLLLHDLGPGLADGLSEGEASGSEWRTAPLWGLSASLGAGGLLHDGRARTVDEAIRWHQGQALSSRSRYLALAATDRGLLLAFLEGL